MAFVRFGGLSTTTELISSIFAEMGGRGREFRCQVSARRGNPDQKCTRQRRISDLPPKNRKECLRLQSQRAVQDGRWVPGTRHTRVLPLPNDWWTCVAVYCT